MDLHKFKFDELDLELIFTVRDELSKTIGSEATEAIMKSPFLTRLDEDPLYVHHYDEEYWAQYIYSNYKKRNDDSVNFH